MMMRPRRERQPVQIQTDLVLRGAALLQARGNRHAHRGQDTEQHRQQHLAAKVRERAPWHFGKAYRGRALARHPVADRATRMPEVATLKQA